MEKREIKRGGTQVRTKKAYRPLSRVFVENKKEGSCGRKGPELRGVHPVHYTPSIPEKPRTEKNSLQLKGDLESGGISVYSRFKKQKERKRGW